MRTWPTEMCGDPVTLDTTCTPENMANQLEDVFHNGQIAGQLKYFCRFHFMEWNSCVMFIFSPFFLLGFGLGTSRVSNSSEIGTSNQTTSKVWTQFPKEGKLKHGWLHRILFESQLQGPKGKRKTSSQSVLVAEILQMQWLVVHLTGVGLPLFLIVSELESNPTWSTTQKITRHDLTIQLPILRSAVMMRKNLKDCATRSWETWRISCLESEVNFIHPETGNYWF